MENFKVDLNKLILSALLIFIFAGVTFIQDTIIKLPTSDNTSSFKVTDSSDDTILNVRADGNIGIRKDNPSTALDVVGTVTATQFKGDGSQLSNVKAIANYAGGNQNYQVTQNYGWYGNPRSVTITVPAKGNVIVTASGYADWESKGWDLVLMGILANYEGDPNSNWSAENKWYSYLNILTDYNCTDSSDQYTSFTSHRGFTVNSGGTYTFTLWVNKYSSSAKTELGDINMSAMYFPTGSVSVPNPIIIPGDDDISVNKGTRRTKKTVTGD